MLLLLIIIFLVLPSADPERKILYEIKRHKINKIYMYMHTISGKKVLYIYFMCTWYILHDVHNIYIVYIHREVYIYFLYYFTKNTYTER